MDWWSRSGTIHRKYTGLPRRIDRNEYYFALLYIVRQVTIPYSALQFRGNSPVFWCFEIPRHDAQFSCAIYQPLLAHHWRVHQCLITSRFIAPSIPWGVGAPGGKMWKQLLKDRNFLNNSPIFTIEISTIIHLLFKKHCIQYISN